MDDFFRNGPFNVRQFFLCVRKIVFANSNANLRGQQTETKSGYVYVINCGSCSDIVSETTRITVVAHQSPECVSGERFIILLLLVAYSSTQCPAVAIQFSLITAPPHRCVLEKPKNDVRRTDACHGQRPNGAFLPPTIRVSGLAIVGMPQSAQTNSKKNRTIRMMRKNYKNK